MFDLNYIFPLVGVGVGWLLNELSQLLRLRREDRRAIGRVLTDLMDIRYNLLAVQKVSDELTKRFNMPPQDQLRLRDFFESLVSDIEGFQNRYKDGVNTLASRDPYLGFRLRSKDLIGPAIRQLRSVASADKALSSLWSQMETKVVEKAKSELEELILKLSWLHSLRTWYRVWRHIRRPLEIPPEMEEWMSQVINESQPKVPE